MKNLDLYKSLHDLAYKCLIILENKLESNTAISSNTGWVKQDNDIYIMQEIRKPFWFLAFHRSKDEIKESEEFARFIEVINADKTISSQLNTLVGTRMGGHRIEADSILYNSLSPFLTDTGIKPFDEQILKAKYLEIENELYSTDIEIERITPLCGFLTDTRDIYLDPNMSIVELSDSEITQLLNLGIRIGESIGSGNFIHHIHKFVIKLTYTLPKIIGDENFRQRKGPYSPSPYENGALEQRVLNALRIFKEGQFYPITTISKSKNIFSTSFFLSPATMARTFMINKFQLLKDEKGKFIDFWRIYSGLNISEKHYLSVAIRRFSQANERINVEDKIIDYLISAEALFLSSGGKFQGELKYRLSHRASMFIENTNSKQLEIFKFMQRAYDVRSDIVHGNTPKLPKKDDGTRLTMDEFCQKIEGYLRFSINKTIKIALTAKSPGNILNWEKVVFPNSTAR